MVLLGENLTFAFSFSGARRLESFEFAGCGGGCYNKRVTLKIGNITLDQPTVLAPMASLTDVVFRRLVEEIGGVGMTITEMVSAEGLIRRNLKTMEMMRGSDGKTPGFIQLFGADPVAMGDAAAMVAGETDFDGIDINMGCPAGKVIRKNAGAALMKDPALAACIIRAVRLAAPDLPLTVKMRLGFSRVNAPEFLAMIQGEGADAVTVHFRLQQNRYRVPAAWEYAPKLKEIVQIPLIGNGDIQTREEALERLRYVDGVMIGRGAISDPLIFKRISGGDGSLLSMTDIISRFIELVETHYTEPLRLGRIKAMTRFLVAGRNYSKRFRQEIYRASTFSAAARALLELAERIAPGIGLEAE